MLYARRGACSVKRGVDSVEVHRRASPSSPERPHHPGGAEGNPRLLPEQARLGQAVRHRPDDGAQVETARVDRGCRTSAKDPAHHADPRPESHRGVAAYGLAVAAGRPHGGHAGVPERRGLPAPGWTAACAASIKALRPPPETAFVKPCKTYEPGFLRVVVKYPPAIESEPPRSASRPA